MYYYSHVRRHLITTVKVPSGCLFLACRGVEPLAVTFVLDPPSFEILSVAPTGLRTPIMCGPFHLTTRHEVKSTTSLLYQLHDKPDVRRIAPLQSCQSKTTSDCIRLTVCAASDVPNLLIFSFTIRLASWGPFGNQDTSVTISSCSSGVTDQWSHLCRQHRL